jgi:hypothetical protein
VQLNSVAFVVRTQEPKLCVPLFVGCGRSSELVDNSQQDGVQVPHSGWMCCLTLHALIPLLSVMSGPSRKAYNQASTMLPRHRVCCQLFQVLLLEFRQAHAFRGTPSSDRICISARLLSIGIECIMQSIPSCFCVQTLLDQSHFCL